VSTREKILETAAKLFLTHGYHTTSLAQVARAVHVSKALILWHFASKEQLFHAALQHFLVPYEIDEQVLRGLNEPEQMEKLITDYYDFVAENLSSVKFVLGQVVRGDESSEDLVDRARELYRVYRTILASLLERGCTQGIFALQVQPAEEAALILATLNGLLVQRLVEQTDAADARQLLAHFLRALRGRLCNSLPT
jgi:TetR/AcrR family transcriptional repressor of nem operon